MTSLIAFVTTDDGAWGHVRKVIESKDWDNIFLVGNKESMKFNCEKRHEWVLIDSAKLMPEITHDIRKQLDGRIKDFEADINFVSGTGKEHMAFISAVLKLGVGVRLVALTKDGVREL